MSTWTDFIQDQFFQQLLSPQKFSKSDWRRISSHPMLPMEIVYICHHYSWDWTYISRQRFQRIEKVILTLPFKEWDWSYLTQNAPRDFIDSNPQLPWLAYQSAKKYDYHNVFSYMAPIENVLHKKKRDLLRYTYFDAHHLASLTITNKDYHYLSQNPHHCLAILRKYKDKPWDWKELAKNHAFPPQMMLPYRNEFPRWRWDQSLSHPRISWKCYQTIRKDIHIPNHFRFFIKNHFHLTPSLKVYFQIVRQRFLKGLLIRRVMLRRLTLLVVMIRTVGIDTMSMVMKYI